MAILAQNQLFGWEDVDDLGDLKRLRFVLDNLPDEPLMKQLEQKRLRGRNDYPIRAVWNSVLAGIVFGHETVESLRRELCRNIQLRQICGFDVLSGVTAVPGSHVYSRFLVSLIRERELILQMFEALVNEYGALHEDFGRIVALDGKAINSYATGKPENRCEDHRSDGDAEWGTHEYSGVDEQGKAWKKVKHWFGFKLHLIVDATHELPIAFKLTSAAKNEMPVAHQVIDSMAESYPWLTDRCEYLCADRGLDDGKLVVSSWDDHSIKPIIDIRNCWNDPDITKLVPNTQNVVYDYRGTVQCVCPINGTTRDMAFGGFEQDRNTLKYRCPARHYGYWCASLKKCPITHSVRVPLSTDRRIFTPVARSSYKWDELYKKRTSVERVFSRMDTTYGFEHHTMRGQKKIETRISLAFCVMMAIAAGWSKEDKPHLARSLLATG